MRKFVYLNESNEISKEIYFQFKQNIFHNFFFPINKIFMSLKNKLFCKKKIKIQFMEIKMKISNLDRQPSFFCVNDKCGCDIVNQICKLDNLQAFISISIIVLFTYINSSSNCHHK